MRRKLFVSLHLLAFVLAGMLPLGSAIATEGVEPGPGFLQLESDFGFPDNYAPEIAGTTDQGIYFFAEDPVYGYELHYWTESGTQIIDANVGAADTSFGAAKPYRGGLAINLYENQNLRAITGWHDGERMRWLTKSDINWLPEPTEMAVVGDRIYLFRDEFQQPHTLHSVDLGVSGYDIKLHDWGFNVGDVDENSQDVIFAHDTVNRYSEMTGVGTFLISYVEFAGPGYLDSGLYAVDTSQTQPEWFKLSSKEVDEIEHELESFTVLYTDDSIERFDVTAGSISAPLLLGGSSLTGAYGIEISAGELFVYATGQILYRLVDGTFQMLEYQGQPLGTAEDTGIAVIDDVAYLNLNSQLAAFELGTDLVWDVLQLTGDSSTEGISFAAAWKKQVVFGARSETGNDVFLFDTMTDTLRPIHSEQYPSRAYAEGLTEFDGKLYFYASIPNPDLESGLMVFDGLVVRPVTDRNGRQLGADLDDISSPIALVDGNLFFLATDTTIDKISEAADHHIRLWKLGPNDEFPTLIEWPDFPAGPWDVRLVGLADSVVIEIEDENEQVGVWVYRSGATQISELTFPDGAPSLTSLSSQTMRFGSTDFVRANDQMWIRLGSGNQATVELPGSYFTAPDRQTSIDTSGTYWEDSFIYDVQKIPGLERYLAVTEKFSPNEIALVEITLESDQLVYTQLATLDTEFNDVDLEVVSMAGSQHLFIQADPLGLTGRIFQFPLFDGGGDYVFGSTHKGLLNFSRSEILEVDVNGAMTDLVVSDYRYVADKELIVVTDGDDQVSLAFASEDFSKLYPIGNYLQNGISNLRVSYSEGLATLGSKLFLIANEFDKPDLLMSLDISGNGSNLSTQAAIFDPGDLYTTEVFSRPVGASHNLTLKANYPEPEPDAVQRANTPTAIDDQGFSREGYELLGWAETPTGPVVHEPGGIFPFDRTAVLYAKWQSTTVIEPDPEPDPDPAPAPAPQPPSSGSSAPAVVSVSFATEVGATALNTLRVSAGSQVVLPKLAKEGHVFLGWSETKDGLLVGEAYRPASTVQLHPVFEPVSFKIFLSLPAGAKGESSVMFFGDKELSLPTPTLRDHVFVAWVNAETGERITSDWVPTESVMLAPLFRAGTADEVVNFWRNSKWVSATQMRKLTALVADDALVNGRRTIVIRGFDMRNKDLARGRALNVAIKLRKLGVTDKIVLETEVGGSANKAEVFVN